MTVQHLRLERDLALSAGASEADMRATLLAHRLSAALSADPQASEAEVSPGAVIEAHPNERLAQSILIDRNGRLGSISTEGKMASDLLAGGSRRRAAKPSAAGDIRAGRRDLYPDPGHGGDQFAAVRVLPRTLTFKVAFASRPLSMVLFAH